MRILTGHGRTVLSQRLAAVHRELADSAWRCREIEEDQRLASDEELAALQRRVLQLGVEINQLESLLERAEDSQLESGESIGPGTVIGVVDAVSGTPSEYRLVACDQATDSSVVTVGSTVGQAFLGRRIGSLVTLNSPPGEVRRVQVVSARPIAPQVPDQPAGEAR
jgi:transcription elongation GreA/GreB family factor